MLYHFVGHYHPRKEKMQAIFQALQDNSSSIKMITLKSEREIQSYLQTVTKIRT